MQLIANGAFDAPAPTGAGPADIVDVADEEADSARPLARNFGVRLPRGNSKIVILGRGLAEQPVAGPVAWAGNAVRLAGVRQSQLLRQGRLAYERGLADSANKRPIEELLDRLQPAGGFRAGDAVDIVFACLNERVQPPLQYTTPGGVTVRLHDRALDFENLNAMRAAVDVNGDGAPVDVMLNDASVTKGESAASAIAAVAGALLKPRTGALLLQGLKRALPPAAIASAAQAA